MTTQPEVLRPAITPTAVIPVDIETTAALAAELCHLHELHELYQDKTKRMQTRIAELEAEAASLRGQNIELDRRLAEMEQAGRQALAALTLIDGDIEWREPSPTRKVVRKSITALRQALGDKHD